MAHNPVVYGQVEVVANRERNSTYNVADPLIRPLASPLPFIPMLYSKLLFSSLPPCSQAITQQPK